MQAQDVTPTEVLAWIHQHQWVPVIAVVGGLAVRLVKADTRLPTELPSWLRPYFALLVTALGAGFVALGHGMAWQSVVEQGLMGFALATLGHETLIEGLRGGVEVPVPLLTTPAPAVTAPVALVPVVVATVPVEPAAPESAAPPTPPLPPPPPLPKA